MNKKSFNASDSRSWALCRRRAFYDLHPPEGFGATIDRFDELVMELGIEHEKSVLQELGPYETASSAEHTAELMVQRKPLIYQGTLVDENIGVICQPDFLRLDEGEYRAEDAKLTSSLDGKKAQIAQIGAYDIVLGSARRARALMPKGESYELVEKDLVTASAFLSDMQHLANSDSRPDANYTASKCDACPYNGVCVPEFEDEKNLGLDYFVDNRSIPGLRSLGINTLKELAKANSNDIEGVSYLKRAERREKAILQARSLLEKRITRIGVPVKAAGTSIHFDVETWPFGADGKHGTVYLWGFLVPPYGKENYEYVWSDEENDGDRAGWLSFLEKIKELRERYEACSLIHYTNFELQQIRVYAKRFEMEDDDTVQWLLNDPDSCFDIKEATSNSVILPVTGYGLKTICKNPALVNFQWELQESGSQWSVVRYADYLAIADEEEKKEVKSELLTYNRDDVLATRALETWLENNV